MGRIYSALDRFLPFDRMLDPMFGGGQVQAPMRQPQAPMVPQMAPQSGGIPSVMGFPAMPPMQGAPQAPQAPQRRVPKVNGWRVLDGVLGGGQTFSQSLDAERARPVQQEQAAQERQAIADYVSRFPPERRSEIMLAIKSNPKAFGEAIFTPRVVGESAYTPNGFQTPGMSDAQRAAATKPIPTEGGAYVPQAGSNGVPTGYQFQGAPQIVKSGLDENITEITPGGTPPLSARSPDVGQYIKGQLAGIPGLQLGSADPRSESEIASLPLSAPDTYHRQGAALDFTAPGQKPDEVIAAVRSRMGAGYDVIYHPENGSFHVEPGPTWAPPSGPGGERVISRGSAKPVAGFRPATAEDRQRWSIPEGVPVKINTLTGEPEAIGGMATALPKPPTAQVVSGYGANRAAIEKIDRAMSLLSRAPQSVGLLRGLGDMVNQRADPGGVEARQAIMDIAGQIMSDRSGAAVPAAEMVRLEPYLPQVTDSTDTVRKKLAGLKRELQGVQEQMEYDFPTLGQPGAGQRGAVPSGSPAPPRKPVPRQSAPSSDAPVRVQSPQEAMALPPGTKFVTPDGRVKIR